MQRNRRKSLVALVVAASWSYTCLLWLCLALRFAFQDKWWWLGFLNSLTPYWFAPLLLVGPLAFLVRKRGLQIASLLSFIVFLSLFGQLLVPKWGGQTPDGATITVMTYNLYGGNQDWAAIRDTISESGADVIAMQELNREMAAMIQEELSGSYPYQILDFQDSVISRYPVTLTDVTLPDSWGTPPKVYLLDWNGRKVTLLNAHFYASFLNFNYPFMQWVFREREHQAQLVTEFADQVETPLVVTADFNATDQSGAYRIMTSRLHDSWREAGWGLGHTFPGGSLPDLPRPMIAGYPVPMWVARIDYVFYSDDWQALEARLGVWDGVSDHRPVIAVLALQGGCRISGCLHGLHRPGVPHQYGRRPL
jgi:endonuclease/exonuclease/phosphatase (EEP) superfamily protein YafD